MLTKWVPRWTESRLSWESGQPRGPGARYVLAPTRVLSGFTPSPHSASQCPSSSGSPSIGPAGLWVGAAAPQKEESGYAARQGMIA